MGLQTTISAVNSKTKSLRATIPEGGVEYLGLVDGDKIDWTMETKDGARVLLVRRLNTTIASKESE